MSVCGGVQNLVLILLRLAWQVHYTLTYLPAKYLVFSLGIYSFTQFLNQYLFDFPSSFAYAIHTYMKIQNVPITLQVSCVPPSDALAFTHKSKLSSLFYHQVTVLQSQCWALLSVHFFCSGYFHIHTSCCRTTSPHALSVFLQTDRWVASSLAGASPCEHSCGPLFSFPWGLIWE